MLALVGSGLSNKVIAIRLGISEATVKAHLTRIYQQIGVTDRTQAALWAREHDASGPDSAASWALHAGSAQKRGSWD